MDSIRIQSINENCYRIMQEMEITPGVFREFIVAVTVGSYEDALAAFYGYIYSLKIYEKIVLYRQRTGKGRVSGKELNAIGELFDIPRNENEFDFEYRERIQKEVWNPK